MKVTKTTKREVPLSREALLDAAGVYPPGKFTLWYRRKGGHLPSDILMCDGSGEFFLEWEEVEEREEPGD